MTTDKTKPPRKRRKRRARKKPPRKKPEPVRYVCPGCMREYEVSFCPDCGRGFDWKASTVTK